MAKLNKDDFISALKEMNLLEIKELVEREEILRDEINKIILEIEV